ncbi:hypothetical protein KLP42_10200 [Rhizobium sp. CSW-27]|nr:hypothetical protein [Rhizobium sp. CSW-27]
MAYAERAFALAAVGDEGVSLRAQLEGQLKRTKKPQRRAEIEAELTLPPFPQTLAHIWQAYHRLRARTAAGFSGPRPITWPDIEAFLRQSGMRFSPWEIEILEALDDAFLTAVKT